MQTSKLLFGLAFDQLAVNDLSPVEPLGMVTSLVGVDCPSQVHQVNVKPTRDGSKRNVKVSVSTVYQRGLLQVHLPPAKS